MHCQEHTRGDHQRYISPPKPDGRIVQWRHSHYEKHHDEQALMPGKIQASAEEIREQHDRRKRKIQFLPPLRNVPPDSGGWAQRRFSF